MFLMAVGVQEMAVGWIQVAKQCQDKFSRVLIFAVWDSFANIAKICSSQNKHVYGISNLLKRDSIILPVYNTIQNAV